MLLLVVGSIAGTTAIDFMVKTHDDTPGLYHDHVGQMFNNNNNDNNNNNYYYYYLLQLGCHLVAVVILHVYKT